MGGESFLLAPASLGWVGTTLARGTPFRGQGAKPRALPLPTHPSKTRWGEKLPLPRARVPTKTGQDRGAAAQGRGGLCPGVGGGVPSYPGVRVLWLRRRDQHLWWHRVEGTASGEDREDLPWGSRLPQRSPQGTGGTSPSHSAAVCWQPPGTPKAAALHPAAFSCRGVRLGRSWCPWTGRACRTSPTSGPWTSSARPTATKPRSPWSWWCGWSEPPQSDAAPPPFEELSRGAGWLIPAPSCGQPQHRHGGAARSTT